MLASHNSTILQFPRTACRILTAFTAGFLLSACSMVTPISAGSDTQLVIPDFPSAKEQYGFAVLFKDSMITATDQARREKQVARLSQCYGRVISSYPDDQTYTPLARLEIADAHRSINDNRKARSMYEEAMRLYPENEYLQARAMFSIGRVLDQSGEYQEAKNYYRRVHEEFEGSPSGAVQDIVRRADTSYYSVREAKAPKKKKRKS